MGTFVGREKLLNGLPDWINDETRQHKKKKVLQNILSQEKSSQTLQRNLQNTPFYTIPAVVSPNSIKMIKNALYFAFTYINSFVLQAWSFIFEHMKSSDRWTCSRASPDLQKILERRADKWLFPQVTSKPLC